jgi:hypothetical protein
MPSWLPDRATSKFTTWVGLADTRLQRAQLEPLAPLIATVGGVLGSATAPASTKSVSGPRLLLWVLLLGAVACAGQHQFTHQRAEQGRCR